MREFTARRLMQATLPGHAEEAQAALPLILECRIQCIICIANCMAEC